MEAHDSDASLADTMVHALVGSENHQTTDLTQSCAHDSLEIQVWHDFPTCMTFYTHVPFY